MFVADRIQVIKNREGLEDVTYEMIEKLDEMLTTNGIQHFFSLPEGDDEGIAIDDNEIARCYYDASKNEIEFELVYMLWSKQVRKVSDENIKKAMKAIAEK